MKKLYSIAIKILMLTTLFWIIYTVAYQFIDGWHYAPISEFEKTLDSITRIGWNIGFFLWIASVLSLIDRLMRKF